MKQKGTTKSQGNKHVLDKFYTKENIVDECLALLSLSDYDCIIEPSAGSGAFSDKIDNVHAYDVLPENDSIVQADWLTLDKTQFAGYNKILVVGNPPFGTSGSLAYSFIVESMKFADTVAFILPKGFKKDSMKNRIPLNFSLTREIDLPKNSFTLDNVDYSVPCVFQLWDKSDVLRKKKQDKVTSSLLEFVKKGDADFRVQRVGGRAGKASLDIDASESSNYFLKNTSSFSSDYLVDVINGLFFPTVDDMTGPRSLSKGELIAVLEEALSRG